MPRFFNVFSRLKIRNNISTFIALINVLWQKVIYITLLISYILTDSMNWPIFVKL